MTQISSTAAAAREAARGPGGKFGEQPHPEADVDLEGSSVSLTEVLDRDGGDLGDLDEFDSTSIGRVHVAPDDDGFRFVAGPEIDLEQLAPENVDEPSTWAEEHNGHFVDFMRSRYGFDVEGDEGRSLFGDWLVRVEGSLSADATVGDVPPAVHEQAPRLNFLSQQLHDGSLKSRFHQFLDEQTGPLDEVVDADDGLFVPEDEHGDQTLGSITVHREQDGSFTATARPATDLASFAPSEMSDAEAEEWANDHVDAFDDFMWRRYGFRTQDGVEFGYERLEHTATARLEPSATTDELTTALREQNFGLAKRARDFEDGTFSEAWGRHLAAVEASPRCEGCGRPEGECSMDPCPDVIADRG